jgi:hypothetical protein
MALSTVMSVTRQSLRLKFSKGGILFAARKLLFVKELQKPNRSKLID